MEDETDNRYGSLAAQVYDLDKPVGHSFGDVEFYRQRLSGCSGPILEPAVGNGRIFVPLVEAGFRMQGYDRSPEMLALCRRALAARGLAAPLQLASFEDFRTDTRFEAIIVPAGSIQLVTETAAATSVLRRFHALLADGGRLIFDTDPLSALTDEAPLSREWRSGEDVFRLTAHRLATDLVAQRSITALRYERWRAGRLAEAEAESFALRWWGVHEMTLALRACGFSEVSVTADYEPGKLPDAGCRAITFEAVKRAGTGRQDDRGHMSTATSPEDRDMRFVDLAHAAPALFGAVLALNNRHAVETSELDATRLRRMLDAASFARATPDGLAFVIAFDQDADYDSPNFLWFRARRSRFLYVDRIVVAAEARGQGRARALYQAAFAAARQRRLDRVVCEVNQEPPNPGSDAFHAALGFAEAGRGSPQPGKTVRYLERALNDPA